MRIVFELRGKPQVTGSVKPYGLGVVSEPPKWQGARAEVLIVDCLHWDSDEHRREGDAIYIEGNIEAVRSAFRDVLMLLDANETWARERADAEIARSRQCPTCHAYADVKNEWHGDGHGKACYGLDAERLMFISNEAYERAQVTR